MWNIGTTGRIVSRADSASTPGVLPTSALSTMARCEYSAPFGLPVVPEV